MKKIIIALLVLSIIFSFAACDIIDLGGLNIAQTKNIVLGKEVESVVLRTSEGEKITCEQGTDFYEIFNKVDMGHGDGKKHSYIVQVQLQDEAKFFINMNLYNIGNAQYYETRAQKEGDDAIASMERYYYSEKLSDNQYVSTNMDRSTYKDEEAFGGQTMGADGSMQIYSSDECPMLPQAGTQLIEMYSMAWYPYTLMNMVTLFESYKPYETNGKTYDIDSFVTRECTLYKNYIVFKQTAPFLCLPLGMDIEIVHAMFSAADCSVTQEAYCNVKTGEVELIKVYGNTFWHVPGRTGQNVELDMQIYIHDNAALEGEMKADRFVEYIVSNSDAESASGAGSN